MPPLILHNVPDEELYVGEDGIQRPYAMVFPSPDGFLGGSRRKHAPETGAFGKSIRRSRSKTATPAKREDPTTLAGDAIFSKYLSNISAAQTDSSQRKTSLSSSTTQANISSQTSSIDSGTITSTLSVHKVPTEVILRGFQSLHQFAAIKHYETIAGPICEDYPRDAPPEQRRYRSDLRDQSTLRTRPLTTEEKEKALRFAGGENWIKVTFESAEAAETAIYSSPQTVLGYMVYAEPYRGQAPASSEAIPANTVDQQMPWRTPFSSQTLGPSSSFLSRVDRRHSSTLPRSFTTSSLAQTSRNQQQSLSPPGSHSSSNTLDTATLSTATASSATVIPSTLHPENSIHPQVQDPTGTYCRNIPTARRIRLLPAGQALLPQPSYLQRLLSNIPLLAFFSTDIIGSEVPRQDSGEFDWARATLYWKVCWWLDFWLCLFGGDIAGPLGKED